MPVLDALPSQAAIQLFAGSVLFLFVLNVYLNYRRVVNSIQDHPGYRLLFPISGLLGSILPRIPGVSIGQHWGMLNKHQAFASSGWDVISVVSSYPRATASFILADALAIKEVTFHRARFPKPLNQYAVLAFFGNNIVVSEGEEWKKHRKIAAPAFSEKNTKLAWDETVRIMLDMFDNWGANTPEVTVDHCADLTLSIALLIIGVAGFGRRVSWEEDKQIPPGHQLSFKDALHNVSTYIEVKLITPKWAYHFSKFLRLVQLSFDELELYIQEMIAARKGSEIKEERNDLFNALLDAYEEEDEEGIKLTDSDLIGNIFIFLVAGHETTAHALCFTLGLLALEQDEQEKLYQKITSILPNSKIPACEDMHNLTYPMAVLYESLRLFPPVVFIPKFSAEDTTLPVIRPDGTKGALPVAKDTKLAINVTGLHYNPRYWPDPESFNPSRFFGDWPKDAFLPFSGGPRACLGRRFFETESTVILTMLVSRYKIGLKNPELYEGLTHAERRQKLLASRPGLTATPLSVPLMFQKR